MDLALRDRVALVTGGSGDLGLATARVLLEEGATVALAGRSRERLDAAVARLPRGAPVHVFVADLTDAAQVDDLVAAVTASAGPVDAVVNTVGPVLRTDTPPLYADDEAWRFHFEADLMPVVRTCRAVMPGMKAAGRGAIVNVAATSARHHHGRLAHYSAMKAAVAHVTKTYARDGARHGVRVNAVHPGWIHKEFHRAEGGRRGGAVRRPARRGDQPDDRRHLRGDVLRRSPRPAGGVRERHRLPALRPGELCQRRLDRGRRRVTRRVTRQQMER